jgi:small subunit ribosomal protein S6
MRNRRYETVFILPPDLDEGKSKELLDRLDGVVDKGGGIRVKREDWGVRRLAYPVNRNPKGHYYLLDFVGSAQIVTELERHMRMLENVLRFLTVKTDDRVDLEAAKQEQADEREKEAAREAERREAAAREEERERAAKEQAAKEAALPEESSVEKVEPTEDVSPEEDREEAAEEAPEEAAEEVGDEAEAQADAPAEEEGEEKKIEG